jgi:hypothetical protein
MKEMRASSGPLLLKMRSTISKSEIFGKWFLVTISRAENR